MRLFVRRRIKGFVLEVRGFQFSIYKGNFEE